MISLPGGRSGCWRLLVTGPEPAAWNMALDHALAEAVLRADSPPVLRLYAWSRPSISIGFNQPVRHLRTPLEETRSSGVDVVRRPTGGRAVLHAAELTYGVMASAAMPCFSGGVRETCAAIHRAILRGLSTLGVGDLSLHGGGLAEGGRRGRSANRGQRQGTFSHASAVVGSPRAAVAGVDPRDPMPCFATPNRSEIAWRGRKLVGSAQRRLEGAFLQHGSILLGGDQSLLERIWPGRSGGRPVTLAEVRSGKLGFDEVAEGVRVGFERELGAEFEADCPAGDEQTRARSLVQESYGTDDFLYRI